MKRIELPLGQYGFIFSSLPAACHPVILCDQWVKSEKRILIVVGSSLTETENLAEDVAKLLEIQSYEESIKLELHLLELNPSESNPDFFEKLDFLIKSKVQIIQFLTHPGWWVETSDEDIYQTILNRRRGDVEDYLKFNFRKVFGGFGIG